MAFLDPPYNVRVRDIVGRGRVQHAEFVMASGELSSDGFVAFLRLRCQPRLKSPETAPCITYAWTGAISAILSRLASDVYAAMLNLVAWVKTNAGQGSFYRSQHELIGVFRVGTEPHLNNVELGRHGRSRSNVWHYAGVNVFRAGALDDLKAHPTVKPVALVAEAMKDVTRRGDIVLDTFGGSGTTILAAERVGRKAYVLELEPRFVDVAIRRWQAFAKRDVIHVETGLSFEDIEATGVPCRAPSGTDATRSEGVKFDG